MTALANSTSTPSPGNLEDAPAVASDQRLQHLPAPRLERGERADFVALHKTAIANHIGSKNGGKTALGAFFGHGLQLTLEDRVIVVPPEQVYRTGSARGVDCVGLGVFPSPSQLGSSRIASHV